MTRAAAGSATLTFCFLIIGLKLRKRAHCRDVAREVLYMRRLIGQDPVPCVVTDAQGQILLQNQAALDWFQVANGTPLFLALQQHFASPAAVIFRLQCRINRDGWAKERVACAGGYVHLCVHQICADQLIWRLENLQAGPDAPFAADGLSLPILTANAEGLVLYANAAATQLLGKVPQRVDQIFTPVTASAGDVVEVMAPQGPIRALMAELAGPQAQRDLSFAQFGGSTLGFALSRI